MVTNEFLTKIFLCQLALLLPYFLLLGSANFGFRRFWLLFSVPFSMLIVGLEHVIPMATTEEMEYVVWLNPVEIGSEISHSLSFDFVQIYFIGLTVFSLIFLLRLARLFLEIRKALEVKPESQNLFVLPEAKGSFTFFGRIFLSLEDVSDEMVIQHENEHRKQRHSADLIIYEIYACLFWFNPLIWIGRVELKKVHEYLVDQQMCNQFSVADYKQRLLEKALYDGNNVFLKNTFNSNQLKNRFKMMNTKKNFIGRIKVFSVLFIAGFTMMSFTLNQNSLSIWENNLESFTEIAGQKEKVYDAPEKMAEFIGGMDGLMKYLQSNMVYPSSAKEKGIQGKVHVSFVVSSKGKVKDVKILRGVESSLDNEAMRVVSAMPSWTPAENEGKKVACRMVLPINFKLQD